MFILIFFLVILGRLNLSFVGYQVLNPDEAQMIANAINLVNNNFNLFKLDGTTSGYLNSLILTWPVLFFNLEINFFSTRLTAVFLISFIIFIIYKITQPQIGKNFSIILILPIIVFFSLTKDPDYLHYNSSLLSILLLLSSYFFFQSYKKINKFYLLILSALSLSLIFYSKIQYFPVSILFLLIVFFEFFLNKKIKKILIYGIIYLLPHLIIISLLIITDNFNDFFKNNFIFVIDFIKSSYSNKLFLSSPLITIKEPVNIIHPRFWGHVFLNLIFHIIVLYFLIFLFLLKKIKLKVLFSKEVINLTLIILGIIFVILIPGKTHRHYLISILPFLPVFISQLLFNNIYKGIKLYKNLKKLMIVLLSLIFFSSYFEQNKFYAKKTNFGNFKLSDINFKNPKIFQYLLTNENNNNLYVWGWMPQWYVLSYMSPASRESISEKQIENNSNKKYYRNRLLADLYKNIPVLIIDSVKKNSFMYSNLSYSIKSFPDLYEFVKNNYLQLKKTNSDCPDYFIRKEYYDKIIKRFIDYTFVNNEHKLNKINDFSVTEDICDDSYKFDENSEDFIEIKLNEIHEISKIMILSSKINFEEVNLKISIYFENKLIEEKYSKLKKFPFWSIVSFNEMSKATSIKLDIKNLKYKNFGINELKVLRKN